jgi:hypothetical protein
MMGGVSDMGQPRALIKQKTHMCASDKAVTQVTGPNDRT